MSEYSDYTSHFGGETMDSRVFNVFVKIPTLSTERLILRKITVSDSDDMFDYSRRPEVSRYLLWLPHKDVRVTRGYLRYLQGQYARRNFHDWAVVLRESGKMIGTCGFSHLDVENNAAELGYVLNSDYWGYGYAPEAVWRIMRFGFEDLGFHRIFARILDGNLQSESVCKKCLLRYEATHKRAIMVKGHYETYHEYAILRDEFFAGRANHL